MSLEKEGDVWSDIKYNGKEFVNNGFLTETDHRKSIGSLGIDLGIKSISDTCTMMKASLRFKHQTVNCDEMANFVCMKPGMQF